MPGESRSLWSGETPDGPVTVLFVERFVQVHDLIADHGPGGKFSGIERRRRFGVADGDEGGGVGGLGLVVSEEVMVRLGEDGEFGCAEGSGEDTHGEVLKDRGGVAGVVLKKGFGEATGGFDELRVVEGNEGLEGSVGAVTADGAGFAAGSVEDVHVGGVGHALPEVVEGAAVEIFASILDVLAGVRAGEADDVPDVLGLVRSGAGATSFG